MCVRYAGVCVCVCDDGQSHFPFGKTTQKHAWAALTSMLAHGRVRPPFVFWFSVVVCPHDLGATCEQNNPQDAS